MSLIKSFSESVISSNLFIGSIAGATIETNAIDAVSITTNAFKMPTGAAAGLMFVSDALGNASWTVPLGGGDILGPAVATYNAVARFDGITGKIIQNSLVLVDDAGSLQVAGGTAGNPSFSFTAEPTSGWYRAGAGSVRASITGTDVLTLNSTGVTVPGLTTTTSFRLTSGAPATGRVLLATDALGNATWGVAPPSGAAGANTQVQFNTAGALDASAAFTFTTGTNTLAVPTVVLSGTVANGIQLNPFGAAAGNTKELRFLELAASGTNYVGFKAPSGIGADVIWTLPSTDSAGTQFLRSNGAGILSWATIGSIGPAGVNGNVQFNSSGVFGAVSTFNFTPGTDILDIGGLSLTTAVGGPIGVTLGPFGAGAGNTKELRFLELAASGVNYVGFKASDTLASNVIWTLPVADATVAGQILSSNAAGQLAWVSISAAAGGAPTEVRNPIC